MNQKELLNLLDNIDEQGKETVESKRVLMIDGLNLFFRNFAMMNMVNPVETYSVLLIGMLLMI